jgi:uncharacterized membrane protein YgcG
LESKLLAPDAPDAANLVATNLAAAETTRELSAAAAAAAETAAAETAAAETAVAETAETATATALPRTETRMSWRQRQVWGFLWAPLTARYWWWKIVVHSARKLALAAILTLIDPRTIYMPVATFSLLLALVILQIHLRPFTKIAQNVTDVGVLACACALYFTFILANADKTLRSGTSAAPTLVATMYIGQRSSPTVGRGGGGRGGGGGGGDSVGNDDEFSPLPSSAPAMLALADWLQSGVSALLVFVVLRGPLGRAWRLVVSRTSVCLPTAARRSGSRCCRR